MPQQDNNEQKNLVQDYFSRTADHYVTSDSHRTGKDLQRLLEIGEWDQSVVGLEIDPYTVSEVHGAHRLLELMGPDMLVMTNAGITSGGFFEHVRERGRAWAGSLGSRSVGKASQATPSLGWLSARLGPSQPPRPVSHASGDVGTPHLLPCDR
jgi:hypothetical protein